MSKAEPLTRDIRNRVRRIIRVRAPDTSVATANEIAVKIANEITPIVQQATIKEVEAALRREASWDSLWVADMLDVIIQEHRDAD